MRGEVSSTPVVSLSNHGKRARPSFDRLRTKVACAVEVALHPSGELVEPRQGGCGRPSTSSGRRWCARSRCHSTPVVSSSNHGKADVAVLRQAQDEGGVRGEVPLHPSGELVEPRQGGCGRPSTSSGRRRRARRGRALTSTPVVSLSNHGNADAAVLRQAQDEGGARGGSRHSVPSTPVVSLSNHGKAPAAVLRQAQDEGGVAR